MPIPEQSQMKMSPDEAAASLGFATNLMSQMMPKAPEGQQPQEMAPEQDDMRGMEEDTITPRMDEMEAKFEELEKGVKQTIKEEIGQIKELVQSALEEDDKEPKDDEKK